MRYAQGRGVRGHVPLRPALIDQVRRRFQCFFFFKQKTAYEMDEAIIQYVKKQYNLLIGERTAEQIKIEVGSAFPLEERITMEIKGRHLIEGVPKTITITDEEIREALAETVNVIVDAVRVALERTPPELSADIVDRGIVLTGGGSMLKNLDKRLREETGLPLAMAEDPLSSVVLGAGKMLSDFNLLRKISLD